MNGVIVRDLGWKRILNELKLIDNSEVKIGVMGDDSYGDGTSIVDVATYNEFGTHGRSVRSSDASIAAFFGASQAESAEVGSRAIPARPFMRQAFDKSIDKLSEVKKGLLNDIYLGGTTTRGALDKLGVIHKGQIQDTITSGNFAANAPSTIARKGSSQPLIDTGRLRQSIDFETELKK